MPDPLQIEDLQRRLDAVATAKTKAWWEAYLKHVIPFRGAKMGDIRKAVHAWHREHELTDLAASQQLGLASTLIQQRHADDKLAGIVYLHERVLAEDDLAWPEALAIFVPLFDDGHIADWNVCDWFCVKVLANLIRRFGQPCAEAIAGWRSAPVLWRQRASCVAFVTLAEDGDGNFAGFMELLFATCRVTVRNPERFAQTGTGWLLRELGVADEPAVRAFIKAELAHFNAEGLRYATEKMDSEYKRELRARRKRLQH